MKVDGIGGPSALYALRCRSPRYRNVSKAWQVTNRRGIHYVEQMLLGLDDEQTRGNVGHQELGKLKESEDRSAEEEAKDVSDIAQQSNPRVNVDLLDSGPQRRIIKDLRLKREKKASTRNDVCAKIQSCRGKSPSDRINRRRQHSSSSQLTLSLP